MWQYVPPKHINCKGYNKNCVNSVYLYVAAKCGGTRKLPRAPYEDPVSLPSGTPKRSSNEKPRPVVVTTTSHGSTGEQPTAHAKDLRSHTMAPSSSDKELDDVEGGMLH